MADLVLIAGALVVLGGLAYAVAAQLRRNRPDPFATVANPVEPPGPDPYDALLEALVAFRAENSGPAHAYAHPATIARLTVAIPPTSFGPRMAATFPGFIEGATGLTLHESRHVPAGSFYIVVAPLPGTSGAVIGDRFPRRAGTP